VDGKIFNSRGVHVAIVLGPTIFDLKGKKLYDLRRVNIYRLSGELVATCLLKSLETSSFSTMPTSSPT
jgi:hypothetical protein